MKYLAMLLTLATIPAFAEQKNSIRVHMGAGPAALKSETVSADTRRIKLDYMPIIGVGYERKLEDGVVGLTILSNQTLLFSLGNTF